MIKRLGRLVGLSMLVLTGWSAVSLAGTAPASLAPVATKSSTTSDHRELEALKGPFKTGPEVTKACLTCHNKAAHQVMTSIHWTWEAENPVTGKKLGKKFAANNFCGSPLSNEPRCTSCHAGYGWTDKDFDFSKQENVDCLACTHLDACGHARMVDVGAKAETAREAVAQAVITMTPAAFAQLEAGASKKGDVLAVTARIAGIQAGKRTSEIIPLCHPIPLSSLAIELEPDPARSAVRVLATARTTGRTGVEMEALVAASVAALTVYDMLKAVDRAMVVGEVTLLRKTGGKSGTYER